jgi:hypothetical protein
MTTMQMICGYVVCAFLGLLCATILWMIWTNKIDLSTLLSEANGGASMSRFQLLVFTMVVAISLFLLVEKGAGSFPEIPNGVLTLLGISASTYAVGKGISYSRDEGVTTPEERNNRLQAAQAMSATGAASVVTGSVAASSGATDVNN